MKKLTLPDIVGILALAFIAWALFSWLDIITHNIDASPVYASWNLFTIFFN